MANIFDAIANRIGNKSANSKTVLDKAKLLELQPDQEAALREAAARRVIANEQFRAEGSPLGGRIIRGAAMGAQSALAGPTRGNSALAGVVAGIQSLAGLQGQEAQMGAERERSATDALVSLISERRANVAEGLKGETERGDTVSRLLAQSDAIRVIKPGEVPNANEIAQNIGGINYAITPKPDTSALIRLMSATGKGADEIQKTYLKLYSDAMAALQKPKTASDSSERARAVEQARMSRDELFKTFGIRLPEVVEMTAEEKAPQGSMEKIITALTGGQDLPRARMSTPMDAVEGLGITPEQAARIPSRDLSLAAQQPDPNKRAMAVNLLIKKYAGGK